MPTTICVTCTDESRTEKANAFATQHDYPFVSAGNDSYELQLVFALDKIELLDKTLNTTISVDFLEGSS